MEKWLYISGPLGSTEPLPQSFLLPFSTTFASIKTTAFDLNYGNIVRGLGDTATLNVAEFPKTPLKKKRCQLHVLLWGGCCKLLSQYHQPRLVMSMGYNLTHIIF